MTGLTAIPVVLAQVTGSISGPTLTISSTQSGAVATGLLIGPGVAAGTKIVAGSGTAWTVNNSQSVASGTMCVIAGDPPPRGSGARAVDFLAEAKANPVYALGTLTTLGGILPYLLALADQLALDYPAVSGVRAKTSPDGRTRTLLAEIIVAAGG